jgi:hypothetical protein
VCAFADIKHLSVVCRSAAPLLVSKGCLCCPQLQSTFLRSLSPRCGSPIVVYPDPQDLQVQTTPKAMLHAATLTHSHVRHSWHKCCRTITSSAISFACRLKTLAAICTITSAGLPRRCYMYQELLTRKDMYKLQNTDKRRSTKEIRSEKCVVRQFRRCAKAYLHKRR